jgi:Cys-tRNA(Pro)/Cys-tRNA(Cys) deacylase
MTATTPQAAEPLRGFPAVRWSLDEHDVRYEIVRHRPATNALAEAHACGAEPRRMVETIGLWTKGQLKAVALLASERLATRRVQRLLGDNGARLATDDELSRECPGLDAGALPPFGAPGPPLALVDRRVLSFNWVLANGGDHRHSIRVSPLEIIRLSCARVVDIGNR